MTRLPATGDPGYDDARAAGLDALRRGEVAQVVLAGGMATRFGGVVKAVLTAVDGKSFLEAKLVQTAALERELGVRVPVALMTSFATDEAIREHVAERGLGEPSSSTSSSRCGWTPAASCFVTRPAGVAVRAWPRRPLPGAAALRHARGASRPWRPRRNGLERRQPRRARRSRRRRSAPVGGRPLTCEVARKEGDMGGAPVRVDGKLQLVEGPRFPPSFDQELVPVFNTNTALFDLDALDVDYDLTWLYVLKDVDGRPAVQLERLYHEVSAFVPTQYSRCRVEARAGAFCRSRRRQTSSARRTTCASSSPRRSDTNRHTSVTDCARTVGACGCSTSSCPSAARSASARPRSVRSLRASFAGSRPPVCERCGSPGPWPVRRCAECAGRRLAFATRARRSSTTARRGRSCARGRSVAAGASRATRPRSSPRSFRGR